MIHRISFTFVLAAGLGGLLLGMGIVADLAIVAGLGGLTLGIALAPWMVEVDEDENDDAE